MAKDIEMTGETPESEKTRPGTGVDAGAAETAETKAAKKRPARTTVGRKAAPKKSAAKKKSPPKKKAAPRRAATQPSPATKSRPARARTTQGRVERAGEAAGSVRAKSAARPKATAPPAPEEEYNFDGDAFDAAVDAAVAETIERALGPGGIAGLAAKSAGAPGAAPRPRARRPRSAGLATVFSGCLVVLLTAAVCGVVYFAEAMAGGQIAEKPDFVAAREIMAGKKGMITLSSGDQNVVGQPYLLYIPAPNFEPKQHNAHGYRGPLIPVRRTPGVARILFLGGSTTYCWKIELLDRTWPEMVRKYLSENLPPDITGVEIINGGLPNGTSAELMNHYHFKYRYYKPDVVVINSGGNDAQDTEKPFYQPDYSHSRQTMRNVQPLPQEYQWVMKSNIMSLFLMKCLDYGDVSRQRFVINRRDAGDPPPVNWFDGVMEYRPPEGRIYEDFFYAFRRNMETLLRDINADGAKIFMIPFQVNPKVPLWGAINDLAKKNEKIAEELAGEFGATWADYPYHEMPREMWADECHLWPNGQEWKANKLAPQILEVLKGARIRDQE